MRSGGPDDPAGKYASVISPILGVEDAIHEEMGMAGQYIDVFALGLETKQVGIELMPTTAAALIVTHAVIDGDAVRKSFVHGGDNGLYLGIMLISREHSFHPTHLRRIELVRSRVI